MSYLDDVLAATRGINEQTKRHRSNMQMLLSMVAAPTPSVGAPAGSPAAPSGNAGAQAVGDPGGFDPAFQSALSKMIKESGGKLKINSGYRSVTRQAQLYAQALKKYGSPEAARKWVAPPGHSNHNKGLAADLGFTTPDAVSWAHQNAARYGLVFPLANENWHIEPVGARKH